jgi:Ca-activated chloride channel homolog
MSVIKKHINPLLSQVYPKHTRINYLIIFFLSSIFYLLPSTLKAQQEKKLIHEGNKQYENKKFGEAEKEYSKALNKNKDSYKGAFNLGDAYYQQGKYEQAAEQFQLLTHRATSKDTLSKAFHNLGNALLKSKKYEEGVNAYKNALKNNPNDEETRYNLAYAQQMLKQQQQQNKDKNKDQKKDDKENKDNKEQQNKDKNDEKDKKENDKKENKEQDKKDENKENKQEEKPKKEEISKEDANRLLDALQNDEKNLQYKRKKAKGVKVDIEKDW